MASTSTPTTIPTLDGLHLRGTIVMPDVAPTSAALLVHDGGLTREEGGFFARLATGLAEWGVASLRYDLRGHGDSDGDPEQSSLIAHLNDIWFAAQHLAQVTEVWNTHLIGSGFSGGLAAYYAAQRPDEVIRLVLLNPQLDYQSYLVAEASAWSEEPHEESDFGDAVARLGEYGHLDHSAAMRRSRTLLNEVFWIKPDESIGDIQAPTLIVHGTRDSLVPVESSRRAVEQLRAHHQLVEIDGADHGFAVHDDTGYVLPQTRRWQALVTRTVRAWVASPP